MTARSFTAGAAAQPLSKPLDSTNFVRPPATVVPHNLTPHNSNVSGGVTVAFPTTWPTASSTPKTGQLWPRGSG